MIKKIIQKTKIITKNFQEKLIVNGNNILDKQEIVSRINNFFCKTGPKLAEKIQSSKYSFEHYIGSVNTKFLEQTVSINELNPKKSRIQ